LGCNLQKEDMVLWSRAILGTTCMQWLQKEGAGCTCSSLQDTLCCRNSLIIRLQLYQVCSRQRDNANLTFPNNSSLLVRLSLSEAMNANTMGVANFRTQL